MRKYLLLGELLNLALILVNVNRWWLLLIRVVLLFFWIKPAPKRSLEFLSDNQKEAKYLALQNQINPHFLYNTLEGIRSEALVGGLPSVAQMSELLARFFRYNISHLDQLVTVEEEISNLETYFQIQQFRFEDRIKLETFFEGERAQILAAEVPKLILQPIVENAIQHGLEPLTRQGTITLRFQIYEGFLAIIVSDDGVGMSPEHLNVLNEKMLSPSTLEGSIGVENTNKRIQLLYGSEYGLQFYSKVGHGTDVEVTLPVKGE